MFECCLDFKLDIFCWIYSTGLCATISRLKMWQSWAQSEVTVEVAQFRTCALPTLPSISIVWPYSEFTSVAHLPLAVAVSSGRKRKESVFAVASHALDRNRRGCCVSLHCSYTVTVWPTRTGCFVYVWKVYGSNPTKSIKIHLRLIRDPFEIHSNPSKSALCVQSDHLNYPRDVVVECMEKVRNEVL